MFHVDSVLLILNAATAQCLKEHGIELLSALSHVICRYVMNICHVDSVTEDLYALTLLVFFCIATGPR